jgi:nucleotidyltransferase/DNA polymerase involved in DNA repair
VPASVRALWHKQQFCVGTNMLLARLATKGAKPNGQFFVENAQTFIASQKVSDLPGACMS